MTVAGVKEFGLRRARMSDFTFDPVPKADEFYSPVLPVDFMRTVKVWSSTFSLSVIFAVVLLTPAVVAAWYFFVSGTIYGLGSSAFLSAVLFGIVWTGGAVVALLTLPYKYLHLRYVLAGKNEDALAAWLEARYGIVYDVDAESDQEKLFAMSSLSEPGSFKDANGELVTVERNADGKLYVVEGSSVPSVMSE